MVLMTHSTALVIVLLAFVFLLDVIFVAGVFTLAALKSATPAQRTV